MFQYRMAQGRSKRISDSRWTGGIQRNFESWHIILKPLNVFAIYFCQACQQVVAML